MSAATVPAPRPVMTLPPVDDGDAVGLYLAVSVRGFLGLCLPAFAVPS